MCFWLYIYSNIGRTFSAQLVKVIQRSCGAVQKSEYLDATYIHLALLLSSRGLDSIVFVWISGN